MSTWHGGSDFLGEVPSSPTRKAKKGGYNTELFKEAGKLWASSEERPNYEALAAAEKEKNQAFRSYSLDFKPLVGSRRRVQEVFSLLGPDTGSGQVPSGESGSSGHAEGRTELERVRAHEEAGGGQDSVEVGGESRGELHPPHRLEAGEGQEEVERIARGAEIRLRALCE